MPDPPPEPIILAVLEARLNEANAAAPAGIERVNASAVNAAVLAAARDEESRCRDRAGNKARGSHIVHPDRNAGQAVVQLVQARVITWDLRPFAQASRLRERGPRLPALPTRTDRRMTHYQPAQRVQVFDPHLRQYIEGGVITATTRCVRVSLDDRMVPIDVDPADRYRIQPLDVPPCTGCTSPLCPDCHSGTNGDRSSSLACSAAPEGMGSELP
jgi:hypothetical protein